MEPNASPARFSSEVVMRVVEQPVKIEGAVLRELYAAHAAETARLAFLLTGDQALAEDLVQDAFVRVTGRLLHLRNRGAFPAYLRASIVNLVRSHARRAAVERRFLERSRDPSASTTRDRDAAEWQRMRDALLQLRSGSGRRSCSASTRTSLEAQIADALRCRPGTVKSLISRGTERLRPLLAKEVP